MTSIRPIASSAIVALSLFAACSGRPADTVAAAPPTARPAATPALAMAVGHGGIESPVVVASNQTAPAAIEPAKDGTTVADVWKGRNTLAGKKVTVRGKVVKFNGGILGVNWIHIQDGTGKPADGTNDITVTSDAGAAVGDVITVTGTITVDKDLGSGYKYTVMIEHASIARQ